MDIEFHYYMTYLIAAKAGYSASESTTIAHAAQSVDDNHIPVRLVDGGGISYENSISQTMDSGGELGRFGGLRIRRVFKWKSTKSHLANSESKSIQGNKLVSLSGGREIAFVRVH